MSNPGPILTSREAAALLGISQRHLNRLVAERALPLSTTITPLGRLYDAAEVLTYARRARGSRPSTEAAAA